MGHNSLQGLSLSPPLSKSGHPRHGLYLSYEDITITVHFPVHPEKRAQQEEMTCPRSLSQCETPLSSSPVPSHEALGAFQHELLHL